MVSIEIGKKVNKEGEELQYLRTGSNAQLYHVQSSEHICNQEF